MTMVVALVRFRRVPALLRVYFSVEAVVVGPVRLICEVDGVQWDRWLWHVCCNVNVITCG